ncbi:Rieske 2Fe-2S domain-containing protein [Aestuariivirga sp.]|uniref:Rieske 2Fe-2S domain-containing protein n=1 Tax=Aestuariivirga sp. TaxID=2650926 RepID=UPI003592ED7E
MSLASAMTDASLETRWFPIAASHDLPLRHVYHAQLLGQEFAVWRADDGFVNVWENRCLHRGVRLSLGHNLGDQLKCQYHGWLYSNRTSNCTYIPAHPENAPARLICNQVYPSVERHGLIWSSVNGTDAPQSLAAGDVAEGVVLRSIPVSEPADTVVEALSTQGDVPLKRVADFELAGNGVSVFVQPVDEGRAIIRGTASLAGEDKISFLRFHNDWMTRLRDRLEAKAGAAA